MLHMGPEEKRYDCISGNPSNSIVNICVYVMLLRSIIGAILCKILHNFAKYILEHNIAQMIAQLCKSLHKC